MKFALAKEHFDFFYQNHYIEFTNLLNPKDVEILKTSIAISLASRLNIKVENLKEQPLQTLYSSGFDTWRDSDTIKKILFRPHLAEIASNLVKKKSLRMGFDQVFFTPLPRENHHHPSEMPSFFYPTTSLAQTSCLQGIACGLILNLDPSPIPTQYSELVINENRKALVPLPRQAGSGIFFSPNTPLSLQHLMTSPNIFQILIAYTKEITLYRLCRDDPHTHAYKNLGYVFGDRLKNTTHPILYRE